MPILKSTATTALAGLVALSACTDVTTATDNPRQRTIEGAALGTALGAATGALLGDNDKDTKNGALIGAVAGAAIGGLIGSQLDQQAQDLKNDFDNGQIKVVNTGSELIVTMPQDILFAVDSAVVSSSLTSDLRVLANSLNEYPDTTVDVIGHTDNTGSASYNQQLSAQRAQSVTSILINSGVSSSRLRAIGRGEAEPVASNLDEAGRAQNRRVEIIIRPNA